MRLEFTVPLLLRLLLLVELLPTVPDDELRLLVPVLPEDTEEDRLDEDEELRPLLTLEDELRLELVRKDEERPVLALELLPLEVRLLLIALELLPPPYERPLL